MYKIRQFIYAWPYQAIRNNIVAKKTTELVLLLHKKINKLVFLRPNICQLCFKVLKKVKHSETISKYQFKINFEIYM